MMGIAYAHNELLKMYDSRSGVKGKGSFKLKEKEVAKENAVRTFINRVIQYDSIEKKECIQYGKTKESQPKFRSDTLQLKDYQVSGVNWLIRAWYERRNVVLADEMGLGKTIISTTLLDHIAKTTKILGPFLVVAPLSTLDHWVKVVSEWTYLNPILYYDRKGQEGRQALIDWEWYMPEITQAGVLTFKSSIFKPHAIITSYEVFMQDINTVLKYIPFMYTVVDEAHRLKNQSAKILNLLKEHPWKNILLLTGTPVQNNTMELFSLLNYIEPDKFWDQDQFIREFGNLTTKDQIDKLYNLIHPHFLRRMKDEVEFSIPPLIETVIDVGLTSLQKAYYKGIYSENRSVLAQFGSKSVKTSQLNNIDIQLRKWCNHLFMLKGVEEDLTETIRSDEEMMQKLKDWSGKLILLDKFIEKFRSQNHKMLIFSQFTQCLDILERYLRLKHIRFEKLTGSVSSADRVLSIQRFNDDKKFGIFLLTTKAGGLGINLATARVVIIFDSDWNPQNDLQAIARAHRIGQKFSVKVYRLVTADTYEQQMFQRASKKLGMEQAIFSKGAFNDISVSQTGNLADIKEDPKEIENLLKYGAYAFLNEENDRNHEIENLDIEKLISEAGEGTLKKGVYSYEKKTFDVSEHEKNIPDFSNDKFWSKVFSDDCVSIANLAKKFKNDSRKLLKNDTALNSFLDQLEIATEDLIKSCKSSNTLNELIKDDEEKIRTILEKILKTKTVDILTKERAKEILETITQTIYTYQSFTKKVRKDLNKKKAEGPMIKKRDKSQSNESSLKTDMSDPSMIFPGTKSLLSSIRQPAIKSEKGNSQLSDNSNKAVGVKAKRALKIKQKKKEQEEREELLEELKDEKLVRSRNKHLPKINYAEGDESDGNKKNKKKKGNQQKLLSSSDGEETFNDNVLDLDSEYNEKSKGKKRPKLNDNAEENIDSEDENKDTREDEEIEMSNDHPKKKKEAKNSNDQAINQIKQHSLKEIWSTWNEKSPTVKFAWVGKWGRFFHEGRWAYKLTINPLLKETQTISNNWICKDWLHNEGIWLYWQCKGLYFKEEIQQQLNKTDIKMKKGENIKIVTKKASKSPSKKKATDNTKNGSVSIIIRKSILENDSQENSKESSDPIFKWNYRRGWKNYFHKNCWQEMLDEFTWNRKLSHDQQEMVDNLRKEKICPQHIWFYSLEPEPTNEHNLEWGGSVTFKKEYNSWKGYYLKSLSENSIKYRIANYKYLNLI